MHVRKRASVTRMHDSPPTYLSHEHGESLAFVSPTNSGTYSKKNPSRQIVSQRIVTIISIMLSTAFGATTQVSTPLALLSEYSNSVADRDTGVFATSD